jgi:hypothetical protein
VKAGEVVVDSFVLWLGEDGIVRRVDGETLPKLTVLEAWLEIGEPHDPPAS